MRKNLAGISFLIFGISAVLWVLLTVFESALVRMPAIAERILIFVLLILPAGMGAILGFMSLIRREGRVWWAVASIILNGLFALFNGAILVFAG